MAVESELAIQFIYDQLTGDASLSSETGIASRVVEGIAPQGTTEPYISVQGQDFFDALGVGAVRIFSDDEFLVRAIKASESFDSEIVKFARRIDTALHNTMSSVTGGEIYSSIRTREFRMTEVDDDGVMHKHLGGFYSIIVQDT